MAYNSFFANPPANSSNVNPNGGGLFGLSQNTQNNNTTPFGNTNPAPNPLQPQPTQPSLFGNPNTNAGTNTNANQNMTTNTGGSLFGQQPQQPSMGGSIFGNPNNNPTATSTSGGSGQQQPLSNMFSSLNSRSNPIAGVGTGITGQQQQAEAQEQYIKITQGVETVYNAWNPSSKDCRFQYNFYNLVDPKQVNMYGRPPNATNDTLWEKAVRENPDPTCLVPVVAIGFDDLRERANAQSAQSSSHLQKLTDLSSRLKSLLTEHSISNASRLQRAHNAQTQLTQRLMRSVQHLHLLIPAVRSSSILVEEEELRGRLEEMEEELRRGRVKGKLNEMWALLGAVGAFMERSRGDGQGGPGEWAVVDEEGLAQITQILAEQQAGLGHLTKILQKDQKDLAIIMGSGTAGGDDGYSANEGENMWSSTNTSLRSSSLR